jgi:uncharacterized protein (DUF362 family)
MDADELSIDRIGRRDALMRLLQPTGLAVGAAGTALWLSNRSPRRDESDVRTLRRNLGVAPDPSLPQVVIAHGDDPRRLLRSTVQELGGIRRFIARGDVVVLKPNIAWDRTPEQGANTNPLVVAEMVKLCHEAGAARVIVTDVSTNEPRRCFQRSGIEEAARSEGAQVILPGLNLFREVDLHGTVLGSWPVLEPFLTADKIVNLPVAKHHSLTGATLGLKNWYGILGGQRHRLHQRIHESLADLASFIRPTLTIIDAYRVLMRNGPTGGNIEDVALKKTLIGGTDPVALDAYVAKAYWDLPAERLPYLRLASERGLGTSEFETLRTASLML